MILADLINTEISGLAKKQLKLYSDISDQEIDLLLSKIVFTDNWSNILEIKTIINYNPILSQIDKLNFYMECAYGVPYPEDRLIRLAHVKTKLRAEPDNILLVYFWIYYSLREMSDDQVYVDLPFFLDEIIEAYPELITLDDFLDNSFRVQLNEDAVKLSPKLYMHVFKKAILKYPHKKSFHHFLAMSYLYNGNLDLAIDKLFFLHNWILDAFKDFQDENVEDYYIFYHYTNLVSGVIQSLEKRTNYKRIIEIANMTQKTFFNQFKNADTDRYMYSEFFVELAFIKMKAQLQLNKVEEIKKEFLSIQPYVENEAFDFLESKYNDLYNILNPKH